MKTVELMTDIVLLSTSYDKFLMEVEVVEGVGGGVAIPHNRPRCGGALLFTPPLMSLFIQQWHNVRI